VLSEAIADLGIARERIRAVSTPPHGLRGSFRAFVFLAAGPHTHGTPPIHRSFFACSVPRLNSGTSNPFEHTQIFFRLIGSGGGAVEVEEEQEVALEFADPGVPAEGSTRGTGGSIWATSFITKASTLPSASSSPRSGKRAWVMRNAPTVAMPMSALYLSPSFF
jgi:hypothetical protein